MEASRDASVLDEGIHHLAHHRETPEVAEEEEEGDAAVVGDKVVEEEEGRRIDHDGRFLSKRSTLREQRSTDRRRCRSACHPNLENGDVGAHTLAAEAEVLGPKVHLVEEDAGRAARPAERG